MTSELWKYLSEQLNVFLIVKKKKKLKVAKNLKKWSFKQKLFYII